MTSQNREQEEVERDEGADHAALEQQQEDVVLLDAVRDGRPGREHGDGAHQGGQQDQQHAEAVHAEEVVGADGGDPRDPLDELVLRARRVVPEPDRHRHQESEERDEVRDPADQVLLTLVHEEQQNGPRNRREEDGGQDREVGGVAHCCSPGVRGT